MTQNVGGTSYSWKTGLASISITPSLIDSDSAMWIAEKEGGKHFRNKYINYRIEERLLKGSAIYISAWEITYTNRENDHIFFGLGIDANTGRILQVWDTIVRDDKEGSLFILNQNYPNPFNSTTKINFSIPKETLVKVTIYNILGEKVATLLNERMKMGFHSVKFNSNGLSSGLYFYRLKTLEFCETKKMLIQN